jgi:hypothetical protein
MLPAHIETIRVGTFDIMTGEAVIADPCYSQDDIPSLGILTSATNGTYHAVIERATGIYGRVSRLYAIHDGATEKQLSDPRRLTLIPDGSDMTAGIPVDSGQVTICDASMYEGGTDSQWYGLLCDMSLDYDGNQAGAFCGGCISSSGYGDGFYPVFACVDDMGNELGWCVEFISDEELNE